MKCENQQRSSSLSSLPHIVHNGSNAMKDDHVLPRGVERVILSMNSSPDNIALNQIVQETTRRLAMEGKRVSLPPKRLEDGIAIDWLYDRSVESEDTRTILGRIIPDIKDKYPSQSSGHSEDPIVIDCEDGPKPVGTAAGNEAGINLGITSSSMSIRRHASEPTASANLFSDPRRYGSECTANHGRRPRSPSSGGQFTLTNLASNTTQTDIIRSLQLCNIAAEAIANVHIWNAIVGTVATVYVASGYDAKALENQFRGPTLSSFADDRKGGRPVDQTITSGRPSINNPVSGVLEPDDMNSLGTQRDTVDDVFVSDNHEPIDMPDGRRHKDSIPSAGSLNIMRDRVAGNNFVDSRPRTVSPSALWQDMSSDSESDIEAQSDDHLSAIPITIEPEEELADRLLRGDISEVRRYLKDAPAHQRGYIRLLQTHSQDISREQRLDNAEERAYNHEQESTIPHGGGTRRKADSSNEKARSRQTQRRASTAKSSLDDNLAVTVTLPKAEHAKGRRLLVPSDKGLPIAAIYMRGEAHFIDQTARKHIAPFTLAQEDYRHVVDAHLLDENMVVIGYDKGPIQVSCIVLNKKRPYMVDLAHRGHTTVKEHRRTGTSSPNPGISVLAPMPPSASGRGRFLSGGGDGTIRMWTLAQSQGHNIEGTSTYLPLSPALSIRCLAYQVSTDQVFVGHSSHISCTKLESPKAPKPTLLSAPPHQIHIHPQAPQVVILEVDHLDKQAQIYDLRRSNFDKQAVMEFGYRDFSSSMNPPPTSAKRAPHRYHKGSTSGSLFARGYADGSLCLFDYRNRTNVVAKRRMREDAVAHAVLAGDQVIAYGAYKATFWTLGDFQLDMHTGRLKL